MLTSMNLISQDDLSLLGLGAYNSIRTSNLSAIDLESRIIQNLDLQFQLELDDCIDSCLVATCEEHGRGLGFSNPCYQEETNVPAEEAEQIQYRWLEQPGTAQGGL